jgi:transposase
MQVSCAFSVAMTTERKAYPTDVSDDQWAFCAPYLTLMKEDAVQRKYSLREVFNGLLYMVRAGCPWRMLPNDLPPWHTIHQQAMRWFKAQSIESMVHDLRALVRMAAGRTSPVPTAIAVDSRTLQSTPESGHRAAYDGYKRKKGSKIHIAVDTLGDLLTLHVTPADIQDRAEVGKVAEAVQEVTGNNVSLAYVDQGYTGETAKVAAQTHGVELFIVKLPEAKKGFVLLPRRWVVERSFGWLSRCRRLGRDYERLTTTLSGMHWVAFFLLLLRKSSIQITESA